MKRRNKKRNSESDVLKKTDPGKILGKDSSFAVKEAYNALRTNLLFMQQADTCPVFVVTSPNANNGKTINSINLAVSFAQMGKKTLIIDADMRNPSQHRMFSIPAKNGLSEILAGITDNIAVSKTHIENLFVLTAGKIPPNPTELLSSDRMDKLLSFVKEHYDCVIVDTPPVNIVTDATLFAHKVTGYILVVKTDTTHTGDVKTTLRNLEQIHANVLGFVLNDMNSDKKQYFSYYKHYKYYSNYNYYYDDYNTDNRTER